MLRSIRKMFQGPDDVGSRAALAKLKETRKRDEGRRDEISKKVSLLLDMEKDLFEEGKKPGITGTRKLFLARRIKEVRQAIREHGDREKIYDARLRTASTHIQSLETSIEIESETVPTGEALMSAAVQAQGLLKDLSSLEETAVGIGVPFMGDVRDPEEEKIVAELEELSAVERRKKEPKEEAAKKPVREAEPLEEE